MMCSARKISGSATVHVDVLFSTCVSFEPASALAETTSVVAVLTSRDADCNSVSCVSNTSLHIMPRK